jgi:hypothetical protein
MASLPTTHVFRSKATVLGRPVERLCKRPASSADRNQTTRAARRLEDLDEDEPLEGALRRRRVRVKTRATYTKIATDFKVTANLTDAATPTRVDHALDSALVTCFLAGKEAPAARYLYYAIRWWFVFRDTDLRLAKASLQGYLANTRETARDPTTWENALLAAYHLLQPLQHDAVIAALPLEVAVKTLLAFDLYTRQEELSLAATKDLLPPPRTLPGCGPLPWTLTLFPPEGAARSKTNDIDDTIPIGTSNRKRRWLGEVAAALKRRRHNTTNLWTTPTLSYNKVITDITTKHHLDPFTSHQLRHGGPSCDALEEDATELALATRGRWRSLASVRRYRKTGRYLRKLSLLTEAQLREAILADKWLRQHLPRLIAQTE